MKKLILIEAALLLTLVGAFDLKLSANSSPTPQSNPPQGPTIIATVDSNRVARPLHKVGDPLPFAVYRRYRGYISQNIDRIETVEQAARGCHCNAARLNLYFKHYAHQSVDHYLSQLKTKQTAASFENSVVVLQGDWSVAERAGNRD
jgi:hypothetical protein